MRDRRFIAVHRGGTLKKEHHILLIKWACHCTENVLPLLGNKTDERLTKALSVAREWAKGNVSVGDAREASLQAIEAANEFSDPVAVAVARAAGHAVATAHMADHSLGAALYALKALKNAGRSVESERNWQNEQLPEDIRELVLTNRTMKEKDLFLNDKTLHSLFSCKPILRQ